MIEVTRGAPDWKQSEGIPQEVREKMVELMPKYLSFIVSRGLDNLSQEVVGEFFDSVLPEIEWETLMWQKTADEDGYAVGSITLLSLTEHEGFQVLFNKDELQLSESNSSGSQLMVFCNG